MPVRRIKGPVIFIIHVANIQKWRENFLDEDSWDSVVKILIHGEEVRDGASEGNNSCALIVSLFVAESVRVEVGLEEFSFDGRLDVARIVYSVDEHSLEQLVGEIWK